MSQWSIEINDFLGGFAPAWYNQGTYPSYGNKNQAGDMTNVDLTSPAWFTQGPGLANLTNGTQAGAVTTLLNSILDEAVSADVTFGVGGNKLQKISSTAVINTGIWPHTIDKTGVTGEDGEDVCVYQGNLYYSYNHSGSAGDIGKYDLASTFDDDWGSTVPSGFAALQGGVPHQMIVGGNDVMYITNGRYIASYDGTTLMPTALDVPTGTVAQSIAWNSDRLWLIANRPSLTGANKNNASVFLWDGTTNSWEAEVKLMGTAGGSHVKNGVLFVFYQDVTSTGGYKLAYVNGGAISDIASYSGSLPEFGQITDYKDFILWVSSGLVYAFGSGDKELPVRLFQIADGGYSTVGALSCPFGTPMLASTESTNFKLAQFSGYDVNSLYKTLIFDVTGSTGLSRIDTVVFTFEQLASGASLAWSLVNNKGVTIFTDTISFAKLGAATSCVYNLNGKLTENFRVQTDTSAGSTTNPVKVKSIRIFGNSEQ
jgi:hypothetical protein